MNKYKPWEIEEKWMKKWESQPLYLVEDFSAKKKYYALVEFPYPSGSGLHLGHAFTDTMIDILSRKKRMEGLNVMNPMGWDAFGLPTENYAIKTGIQPAVATKQNTDHFKEQMKRLAFSFNWEREVNTSDPAYFKWTQWIFLQFFKHGLAYKAETPVGWCPSCKIILANEEIVNNACERCGTPAEYRMQKQWLLRITAYADRLADELDLVDYPDYVKQAQRNWIGRTRGVEIFYPVVDKDLTISCYSTRPETNFGATFIVIAPEHPMVEKLITEENKETVLKYIEQSKKRSEMERTSLDKEKTGVFTGSYAFNRLNNKKIPVFVSDFVVLSAGTGIVVGVPAHDERDYEFAKKHDLEVIPVIKPKNSEWNFAKGSFTEIDDAVVFNSDFLNELPVLEAKEKIIDYLVEKGWGKRAVNYHLRDWVFSRQHYWGEPFPLVYCPACAQKGLTYWDTDEGKKIENLKFKIENCREMAGWFPLAESELPLKLPEVKAYQPTDTGESPLANVKDWVKVTCPECGAPARRETDTMPNWAGSSWYFLRFCDSKNDQVFADRKKLDYWMPVDVYLGGAEHTTLHLLYSRFWHKFLNDLNLVPGKEPYAARRQHGVILGEDGLRMSKSRGNVVNPEDIINKFGTDTLRLYLMFMGPYDQTIAWSSKGVEGSWRFLNRVWKIISEAEIGEEVDKGLTRRMHQTIKGVSLDIEELGYNTAIAKIMEYVNDLSKIRNQKLKISKEYYETLVL